MTRTSLFLNGMVLASLLALAQLNAVGNPFAASIAMAQEEEPCAGEPPGPNCACCSCGCWVCE